MKWAPVSYNNLKTDDSAHDISVRLLGNSYLNEWIKKPQNINSDINVSSINPLGGKIRLQRNDTLESITSCV